jgi:hypothetical protein
MKLTIDGKKNYFLKFKYEVLTADEQVSENFRNRIETICWIEDESKNIISQAISVNHAEDNFSRRQGRKHALKNLLKNINLNKTQRTQLWQQYFAYIGNNK